MLRTIAPYYMTIGAFSAAGGCYLSEGFDRAFCTNKATKYGILGAVDLTLIAIFVGPVGSWSNACLAGGILGLTLCGVKNRIIVNTEGDFGNAVEYMPHVTKEEIKKNEIQEARIMGNSHR